MKIQRLDLLAFGPFTNRSLDLSGGNLGLHVIHGHNEAGKSTSLRALKAWLFGIPARTQDNFLHEHKQLRIGGVLRLSEGRELAFVRRKGNKGTLLDPESAQALSDDVLAAFLPGLDERVFGQLYGRDHDARCRGG